VEKDDLLKLLDLSGQEASTQPATELALTPTDPAAGAPASPTALELDDWGLRRGQELLEESERLRATGTDALEAADFHGAAFLPDPTLRQACADPLRHQFLAQLLQTADYRALHQSTLLSPVAAEIAATAFAEQFAQLKKKEGEPGQDAGGQEMEALRAAGNTKSP